MLHVGYENYINSEKIIAIIKNNNNSRGYRRLINQKRDEGKLVELHHSPKSAILMDGGALILTRNTTATLFKKLNKD